MNDENKKLDSQKIDLYINHENDSVEEGGINFLNIFINMKKKARMYILLIFMGLILGIMIPFVSYEVKKTDEGNAISIIGFEFSGAEDGYAPNGEKLDVNYLKSSYIVSKALNNITLSKNVPITSIINNIVVSGVLTDKTQQQLEVIYKLMEADERYLTQLQNFELKYRAQYIVTLNNGFSLGGSTNKKIYLDSTDMEHLLTAIVDAYTEYFVEEFVDVKLPNNQMEAINVETLDYLETLDEIKNYLDYLENYCEAKVAVANDFRASNGLTFSDLANVVSSVKELDIDYVYAYVFLNNITKDKDIQLTNYKYKKKQAELNLAEITRNITTVENSISAYESDKILITSADSATGTTTPVTSDYYNELVNRKTELLEEKENIKKEIAVLDDKIAQLGGAAADAEKVGKAEEYINKSLENAKYLSSLVISTTIELFDSSSYKNGFLSSVQTSEEQDSIFNHVKSFVLGAAIGAVVALLAWCIDGFVMEVKGNKKEIIKEVSLEEKKGDEQHEEK